MRKERNMTLQVITGLCLLMLLGACATYQARSTQTTGFLGDYSQLKPGGEGKALLVYIDPKADFKSYKRIFMDPVKLYASPEHSMSTISLEDRQKLLNYADASIREHLAKDYVFVMEPGPGIMRLRVAITEAEDANVVMDTVSTVLPIGLAISGLQAAATGSCSFVGSAGVEAEMLDSLSNTRLAAAADRRVAGKVTGEFNKFDEWHAVKDAIDYWADRLQTRLAELRAK
jgi:hypothetical protein